MAYTHEIYQDGSTALTINHNRLTPQPSGLMVVRRLASTTLGFGLPESTSSGLLLAKDYPGLPVIPETFPDESIQCNTLDEFLEEGSARILSRVQKLGQVIYFDPNIAYIDQNQDLSSEERTALQMLHIAIHREVSKPRASPPASEKLHTGMYL